MVMAQALYKALQMDSTPAEIHVVASAWSRPLLSRMPEVTRIIELDIAHGELGLVKRLHLGQKLRIERYTQAFVLPRSFKSAIIPWAARVPRRVGDKGEYRYGLLTRMFPTNKDKSIPNVCNYLRYLDIDAEIARVKREFLPQLNVDAVNQQKILQSNHIVSNATLVACMVGAEYGRSKQWPAEHFAVLIDKLSESGLQVCMLGSAKDLPQSETIQKLCKRSVINLCGKTTLPDVVDLLAACRVAVTNDSGLINLTSRIKCAMQNCTSTLSFNRMYLR